MLYGDGGLTDECRMLMLSGRKRLKRVMDILGDSDDAELVTFTMTLVNKVCHSALSLRQTSSSVMLATGCIAAAPIDPSYSPGGAGVHTAG